MSVQTPEQSLREYLEQAIAESSRPLHPDLVPILNGELDPTARASTNRHGETISAELRSLESALGYYTIEGLTIALTPLGMMAVAFQMLQILSGDHGEIPEGVDAAMLDPWGELAGFQALPVRDDAEPSTAGEECRRALWHLGRAYAAAKPEADA